MSAKLDIERLTWGPLGRCVACRIHPAVSPLGYCGTCHWQIVAEIASGWQSFDDLLSNAANEAP